MIVGAPVITKVPYVFDILFHMSILEVVIYSSEIARIVIFYSIFKIMQHISSGIVNDSQNQVINIVLSE